MTISIFDLFSIGIGPSSSHTVGPMRAAHRFISQLVANNLLEQVATVNIEVYGSLAWTGHGHGTREAMLMGLSGEQPESIDPLTVQQQVAEIEQKQQILLNGNHRIPFSTKDLFFNKKDLLPYHSNGMQFRAIAADGKELANEIYYSIGGGFVLSVDETEQTGDTADEVTAIPYPYDYAKQLLELCHSNNMSIAELMMANECSLQSEAEVKDRILAIWKVMNASIDAGCSVTGVLPGKLKVKRRAHNIFVKLQQHKSDSKAFDEGMNWLSVYAIAVNEENAAGGRVVTAPTNGAAGTIPAVLRYLLDTKIITSDDEIINFMLTTAAIGILYKKNASISAAEVGCQGEIGVACSMAAAGFAAVAGGTINQVENAAEIGMEHHLGMTCDPIGGLVQIPCIERNAMGAVQAVNSARLALLGDGQHKVSLDEVIKTMNDTGRDMSTRYKETAQGGLAVNVPEC